jgi:hypothetical protein
LQDAILAQGNNLFSVKADTGTKASGPGIDSSSDGDFSELMRTVRGGMWRGRTKPGWIS